MMLWFWDGGSDESTTEDVRDGGCVAADADPVDHIRSIS